VDFAKNAGAVDGKSAVSASATNAKAAGKLVAAGKSGRIPIKFLDLQGIMRGTKSTFAQGIEVTDNATSAPVGLAAFPGVGIVSATCSDQDNPNPAGQEDPTITLTFTNSSAQTVNFSRTIVGNPATISTVLAATQSSFTINNSQAFEIYMQVGAVHYVVNGVFRQDGKDTPTGLCAVYGYAMAL
jgi:hypothetical protein